MADGTKGYETIDITEFTGLYADKDESQEAFPSTASPYAKNFTMQNGILQSRKGRRRINDTAYDSKITSLIPYVDRNNVEHLVFSVESDSEILEILDGALKVESNAGLRKPLEAILPISEPTSISLADYIKDIKVRGGFIYVLRYFSVMLSAQVEKWTLDGEYVSKHSFSLYPGAYEAFEIDSQGYLYIFEPDDTGIDDALVKYTFSGSEEARVVLDGGVGGATLYSLYINGSTLYAGYNLDGGNCRLDSFDLDLGSRTNLYNPGDTDRIIDIDVTDDGTILIVRRDSAGTTRELRYYDGTVTESIVATKYDSTLPPNSDTTGTNGRIPLGTASNGDIVSAMIPSVIKDGSTYKMWYIGYNGFKYCVYHATSPDGLTWTKYNNVVPVNSDTTSTGGRIPLGTGLAGDTGRIFSCSVIKDGSTYKMWYAGTTGSDYRIYHATSPDGLTWTKYNNAKPANSDTTSTGGRIPLGTAGKGDSDRILACDVIKDDGVYKMWYVGRDGSNYRIYHATSPDGLTWTKYNNTVPALSDTTGTDGRIPLGTAGKGDDTHVLSIRVIKDGDIYKAWYGATGTGYRIYHATSPDGLTWTKYSNTIPADSDTTSTDGRIPLGTAGKGDSSQVRDISIIEDGVLFRIWYTGYDGTNYRIYHATMDATKDWSDTVDSFFINLPSRLRVVEDKVYLSLVDDTETGDSQAAFYTYDHHWNYLERKGNVYLSTTTKNKQWDVTSAVRGNLGSVEAGDIIFDVDDQYIYIVDAITDASYGAGVLYVTKKFRR